MGIYFHSYNQEVRITGRLRFQAREFATNVTLTALNLFSDVNVGGYNNPLAAYFPNIANMSAQDQHDQMRTAIKVNELYDCHIDVGDKRLSLDHIAMNTAMSLASDPMKLLIRLHAQCEIHAFVEQQNKAWLARIVVDGIKTGLYKKAEWQPVVELLQSSEIGPVVTSYSVCEQFPNATVANFTPEARDEDGEPDYDEWYELSKSQRWELAMIGLRTTWKNKQVGLKPENWNDYYFGDGINAYQLMEAIGSKK